MFNSLKRLNEILPDVREDYIHVISVDRDQVGDNKGGGRPADQKDGQKAQSLRPPEHLSQTCDLKSPSAHLFQCSDPGRVRHEELYRQSHGGVNQKKKKRRDIPH